MVTLPRWVRTPEAESAVFALREKPKLVYNIESR